MRQFGVRVRLDLVAVGIGELERAWRQRAQRAEGLRAVAEFEVEKGALAILGEAFFNSSRVLVERRGGLRLGRRTAASKATDASARTARMWTADLRSNKREKRDSFDS